VLSRRRHHHRPAAAIVLLALLPLLADVVVATGATAAPKGHPQPKPLPRVTLHTPKTTGRAPAIKPYARFDPSAHSAVPAAGTTTVSLPAAAAAAAPAGPIHSTGSPRPAAPGTPRPTPSEGDELDACGQRATNW